MLVLTRRPNESIIINDDIIITVLAISGNQVKIGVKAPKTSQSIASKSTKKFNKKSKKQRQQLMMIASNEVYSSVTAQQFTINQIGDRLICLYFQNKWN